MLLGVETVSAEEVDVSMAYFLADNLKEEVDEVEEDMAEDIMEEAAAHMKMELISQLSFITLKIQGGPHYLTKQGKVSLRNRYI